MDTDPATLPVRPLSDQGRLRSLDILRGVAVLGILVMNSRNFALPLQQFDNPAHPAKAGTLPEAGDLVVWALSNIFFEDKMIAIFSMLFGVGIALQSERLGRGLRAAVIHYRRMAWLLVIGLVHAFGLWYGDILNTYAICGMALYPFRRLRPAVLVGLGILVLTVSVWARVGPRIWTTLDPPPVREAAPANAAPATPAVSPPRAESASDRIWRESTDNERAAYTGSYMDLFRWRVKLNVVWHWYAALEFSFWRSGGYILIGMGLVPLFAGARPASVYWGLVIGGYSAGLVMIAAGFWPQYARAVGRGAQAPAEARQVLGSLAWMLRYLGAAAMAMGHVGLVLLLAREARFKAMLSPLAAVGRMALTNYLMHTVIAVIVFDGWALGNWGKWRMTEVVVLVISVWAFQLILSPIWLHFFRFGPMEWLWRSLTYLCPQPMIRKAVPAP